MTDLKQMLDGGWKMLVYKNEFADFYTARVANSDSKLEVAALLKIPLLCRDGETPELAIESVARAIMEA